jgi:hypothetical protein
MALELRSGEMSMSVQQSFRSVLAQCGPYLSVRYGIVLLLTCLLRCDSDHFVLQRDDNHLALSIVGKQYKPVQNTEIFHFFHEFCERGDMILETGGILDEGRKAWALATLQEGFTLARGR